MPSLAARNARRSRLRAYFGYRQLSRAVLDEIERHNARIERHNARIERHNHRRR
jgi:hypothetical protein